MAPAPPPQLLGAAGGPFLGLATGAQLVVLSDRCMEFLLELYMQLLPGLSNTSSRPVTTLLMFWHEEVRSTLPLSGLPVPMQLAILQLLGQLVRQLLSGTADACMPLRGGSASADGCSLVMTVVERLMHALDELKVLSSNNGAMQPIAAGDIAHAWFARMLRQAPLPGDAVVRELVQQVAA